MLIWGNLQVLKGQIKTLPLAQGGCHRSLKIITIAGMAAWHKHDMRRQAMAITRIVALAIVIKHCHYIGRRHNCQANWPMLALIARAIFHKTPNLLVHGAQRADTKAPQPCQKSIGRTSQTMQNLFISYSRSANQPMAWANQGRANHQEDNPLENWQNHTQDADKNQKPAQYWSNPWPDTQKPPPENLAFLGAVATPH